MIQRIQSIYLLAAALCSGLLAFLLPFFQEEEALMLWNMPLFMTGFLLSTLISLFSIFRYRRRQHQVVAGRLNIILNFFMLGMLIYKWYLNYEWSPENLGIGALLPAAVVVFLSLANRNIMKDELLVRSMDRLR